MIKKCSEDEVLGCVRVRVTHHMQRGSGKECFSLFPHDSLLIRACANRTALFLQNEPDEAAE